MEEEHCQHHNHQYGGGGGGGGEGCNTNTMADLRQFFLPVATHHFPVLPTAHHQLFSSTAFTPLSHHHHHYDKTLVMDRRDPLLQATGGGGIHDFHSHTTTTSIAAAVGFAGSGGSAGGGDGGATARWPRQETLTLLEIRSRLDHKFKESNHKGHLWDEVSRIMSEEHGYQRSGKKCREKFENLYKYYKKTKEGQAGRQDGKHYRFFRQLEALCGEASHNHQNETSNHNHINIIGNNNTTTPTLQFHNIINTATINGQCNNHQEGFHSISMSKSEDDLDTSSSEGNDLDRVGSMENGESSMDMMVRSRKRKGRRSWKAKIKDLIDSQMTKIMEKQEALLEKMLRSLEEKEQERMSREEESRKKDAQRMEKEHEFWAAERAWIEARDKALMDAVQRITGKEVVVVEKELSSDHTEELLKQKQSQAQGKNEDRWEESEIMKLIDLRTTMEPRFEQCGGSEEGNLWEEISTRMLCLGHDRSASMCKEKWDFLNGFSEERGKNKNYSKKKNENWRISHHQHLQSSQNNNFYNYGEINSQGEIGLAPPEIGSGGGRKPMNDSCLRILLGDGGESHLWESYGLKLNKGETH